MPSAVHPTLTEDEIDDLIYATRTSDLDDLRAQITDLSSATKHNCAAETLLSATIDQQSGCSLLHYASANGSLEVVTYLLSLLDAPNTVSNATSDTDTDDTASTLVEPTKPHSSSLLNHKNNAGNTPLHWASLNGHLPIVQVLVQAGADATPVNNLGRDAVVEAEVAAESFKEGSQDEKIRRDVAVWLLGNAKGLDEAVRGGANGEEGLDVEEKMVENELEEGIMNRER